MKMVPFFADTIVIVPHTATHEIHIGEAISLKEFGAAHSLSLYEKDGELYCKRADGAFIEGPEKIVPMGAEAALRKPSKPASVQVQTVIHSNNDVETCTATDLDATHWAVYLRGEDGLAEHVKDFEIKIKNSDNIGAAKTSALVRAAMLSMEHGIFIEQIK